MTFDPDFGKTGFARDMLRLRRRLSYRPLTQEEFAQRFGLTSAMVRDQEQGRFKPSRPLRVLLAAIELEPELMAKAAKIADARWPD